jgi:DNA modification methylase
VEVTSWVLHEAECISVLRTLADRSVDVTLMDPPFEIEAHTKARRSLVDTTQRRGAKNSGKVRRIDQPLEISFPPITPELRQAVAGECARVTRRWVIAFCQIEAVGTWKASFEAAGLDWVRGGIWRKPNGAPQFTGDRPGQGFECLAIAHVPVKGHMRWNGEGKHGVWTCPLDHGAGSGIRNEHPTQKPLALMLDLVDDFTEEGETVLDPFAGSGTTGVAALRRGRSFIGCEDNPRFAALARERLAAEEQGLTLGAARAGQLPMFAGAAR